MDRTRKPYIGVRIAPCREGDVDLLESCIPTRGAWHAKRFDEQRKGESLYLIAWLRGVPVGHLNLRLAGSLEEVVRRHLPGCAEINALGVAEQHQGHGIGTQLVEWAEGSARGRQLQRIGMGVAVGNRRAEALYQRLGYTDWGHGTYICSWTETGADGVEKTVSEETRYLVKEL